ncbi:MAG: hypothetical protein AAF402_11505 [Pseudomonadota bacterium]
MTKESSLNYTKRSQWVRSGVIAVASAMFLCSNVLAQESDQGGGLKLPADLKVAPRSDLEIQEFRVGGRLDSVTVRHNSTGITEVYDNDKPGDLWVQEDNELGDVPNVRKWTISSW